MLRQCLQQILLAQVLIYSFLLNCALIFFSPCTPQSESKLGMGVAFGELLKYQNEIFWNLLIPFCKALSLLNILNLTSVHNAHMSISLSLQQVLHLTYITSGVR